MEKRDRRVKIGLLAASLVTIALLAGAALRENILTPWRHFQKEYAGILRQKATDERGRMLADQFTVEMRQVALPELNTVDRCVSCHNGMDDPRMTDVPNPHKIHPGRYLEWHEVNRFGCTTCHRGQGRAMEFKDAKAADVHWDYPLLPKDLTQSSCGVCHSSREVAEHGGEVYAAGAALFEVKGCRSCHKLDGRGGELGPALDNEGLKVAGLLPMAKVRGPHTLPQWLLEHFDDPQKIVAGSRMPQPGLSRTEAQALTTFLLSLQERDLPGSYMSPDRHLDIYAGAHPAAMSGGEIYNRFCANCHDTGRMGRYDKFFQAFIPAVRGRTYQEIAEPVYVAANIRQGRRGTIMPAWGPAAGGLSEDEIRLVTAFVLDRPLTAEEVAPRPPVAHSPLFSPPAAHPARGEALFTRNCVGCHAPGGTGKLGPSLNTPVFQAQASDEFLYRTIAFGRRNTAMPAFFAPQAGGLADSDIRDLVAYLRTFGGTPGTPTAARVPAAGAPSIPLAQAAGESK
jgi:mono/diheme cytochrome c family protein